MVRRVKEAKEVIDKQDWIFKVDIELNSSSKPKIAFLSGVERGYYPEDPGYSKFGQVYQASGFEDETPPCTFIPHPHALVNKPISNKGYSIGGLSGPRFPPLVGAANPSPDKYQPELVQPLRKPKRKIVPEEDDYFHLPPDDPWVSRKNRYLQHQRHLQCYVSFGTSRWISKFGNPPRFNTAGVGSYNVMIPEAPALQIHPSFGRSPVLRQESTKVKCVYEKDEKCIECGRVLRITDFYRTRFSVRVPLPETRAVEYLEKDFPRGVQRVNLCNICYYRASLGDSKNWPKKKLKWLFKKTRTCAFMHEHHGLSEVIQKVDCKTYRKLQRREAILSKYYADRVEDSIPKEDY